MPRSGRRLTSRPFIGGTVPSSQVHTCPYWRRGMRPPIHIMFVLPRGNCIRSNSAQRARSRSEGQPSCYSHPGPVFETYTQLAWQSCTRHVGASRDRSLDMLCLSSTGLRHRSIARTTTSTTRGGAQQTRAEMIWDDTACMTHPSCGAERKVGRTAHWYHLSQTHTPITPGIGARSVSPSLPLRWLRRRMHARAVSVNTVSLLRPHPGNLDRLLHVATASW